MIDTSLDTGVIIAPVRVVNHYSGLYDIFPFVMLGFTVVYYSDRSSITYDTLA